MMKVLQKVLVAISLINLVTAGLYINALITCTSVTLLVCPYMVIADQFLETITFPRITLLCFQCLPLHISVHSCYNNVEGCYSISCV